MDKNKLAKVLIKQIEKRVPEMEYKVSCTIDSTFTLYYAHDSSSVVEKWCLECMLTWHAENVNNNVEININKFVNDLSAETLKDFEDYCVDVIQAVIKTTTQAKD